MPAQRFARLPEIRRAGLALLAGVFVGHAAGTALAQDRDPRPANPAIEFADEFDGPLDPRRWTTRGTCRTEHGLLRMEANRPGPPGPGKSFTFSYLDLKAKCFAPGLSGTNGVEITLDAYTHEREYPVELEADVVREHRMGWGITVASWRGQIGQNNPEDRGVQLHIDWLGRHGLFVSFVRSLLPEDLKKYPNDNVWRVGPEEFRVKQDELIEQGPFISEPCLVMACRIFRPARKFLEQSHRYGIYLTNDARTAFWTLDGRRMDSFDVSGYFASRPDSIRDGLYLTIAGAGIYQENVFTMDDLKIYSSRKVPK
ncbi:MAG: hypothetical protein WD063_16575 [Pirellulales bacterium]